MFLHRTPFWFSAVWTVVAATLPPIAKSIIEITSDSTLLPKLQVLYETTVRGANCGWVHVKLWLGAVARCSVWCDLQAERPMLNGPCGWKAYAG